MTQIEAENLARNCNLNKNYIGYFEPRFSRLSNQWVVWQFIGGVKNDVIVNV